MISKNFFYTHLEMYLVNIFFTNQGYYTRSNLLQNFIQIPPGMRVPRILRGEMVENDRKSQRKLGLS